MIPEEVEYRLAVHYFMRDMEDDFENHLSDTLIDAILKSNDTISNDELVKMGIELIDEYLDQRLGDG